MTNKQATKISKLLAEIDIDVSVEDLAENAGSYDELRDFLLDNDYFNVEIIYYSRAMEYLAENDPSLKESFRIVSEYGYQVENLSSEVLASILASETVQNDFEELEDEISEILGE